MIGMFHLCVPSYIQTHTDWHKTLLTVGIRLTGCTKLLSKHLLKCDTNNFNIAPAQISGAVCPKFFGGTKNLGRGKVLDFR